MSECPICGGESPVDSKALPCNHAFHAECLVEWVQSDAGNADRCPMCRCHMTGVEGAILLHRLKPVVVEAALGEDELETDGETLGSSDSERSGDEEEYAVPEDSDYTAGEEDTAGGTADEDEDEDDDEDDEDEDDDAEQEIDPRGVIGGDATHVPDTTLCVVCNEQANEDLCASCMGEINCPHVAHLRCILVSGVAYSNVSWVCSTCDTALV